VLAADVAVEPFVVFGPKVTVASGAQIKAHSHIEGAKIGAGAIIGPFARLRPGAVIGAGAHIGNFVEIKNAVVDAGAKANHLTYLGDAHVGAGANIGAGVITANYDGVSKSVTDIGADSFVGSNATLVAPVTIADGAYVAAGSTVTDTVDPGDLAVARGRQHNSTGWVLRRRAGTRSDQAARAAGAAPSQQQHTARDQGAGPDATEGQPTS
jgi:bifunctional UDP-N-acetylglucosamine pyrophosphorylase/glucosamine-1-phosphate N-acetyltransferase